MTSKAQSARRSREDWIRAALAVLRDEGIERVKVEPIAARLGVTKGSFYWHFASREALIEAALDTWVALGTESIIQAVAAGGDDAQTQLRSLWQRTLHDASEGLRTELAIRELGQRDPAVRERVRRVDERRMEFMRALFRKLGLSAAAAEARSFQIYSLLIGNYFIAAEHGRLSRAKVLALALEDLLRV